MTDQGEDYELIVAVPDSIKVATDNQNRVLLILQFEDEHHAIPLTKDQAKNIGQALTAPGTQLIVN